MMYTIRVESSYEELYRYNTIVMCGGYDSSLKELYVHSIRDDATEGGEFVLPQIVTLETPIADSIRVVVYIVAHTIPENRDVDTSKPFDVDITISKKGKHVYHKTHEVNQWGGAAIEIKI